MIGSIRNKKLRHRIYQAGFRGIVKIIEEKSLENEVPVVKVNPKGTSSTYPFCNSKLMRGNAPRHLKCSKCNIEMGRDVVAILNIEKKFLTSKGSVPLNPMPYDLTLDVVVLPMKEWVRWNSLPQIQNAIVLNRMKR